MVWGWIGWMDRSSSCVVLRAPMDVTRIARIPLPTNHLHPHRQRRRPMPGLHHAQRAAAARGRQQGMQQRRRRPAASARGAADGVAAALRRALLAARGREKLLGQRVCAQGEIACGAIGFVVIRASVKDGRRSTVDARPACLLTQYIPISLSYITTKTAGPPGDDATRHAAGGQAHRGALAREQHPLPALPGVALALPVRAPAFLVVLFLVGALARMG